MVKRASISSILPVGPLRRFSSYLIHSVRRHAVIHDGDTLKRRDYDITPNFSKVLLRDRRSKDSIAIVTMSMNKDESLLHSSLAAAALDRHVL